MAIENHATFFSIPHIPYPFHERSGEKIQPKLKAATRNPHEEENFFVFEAQIHVLLCAVSLFRVGSERYIRCFISSHHDDDKKESFQRGKY
jgi:hypothetical protein